MDYNRKTVRDNNNSYHTIRGDSFASGGEGEIYKLSGEDGYVAKIYYQKYRTDERHKKLKAMLMTDYNKLPECAWPVSILYDGNEFCGFIMRNMSGYIGLIDFYVYDNRQKYTWAQYVTVAMNIAAVVSSLHELGHIVGDLNPNNILVDTKSCKVAFVDTDSYHIRSKQGILYPCVVATPEFSAPELQGVDFQKLDKNKSVFSTNTDNFSLAVLLFRVLMNGVHPFACSSATLSLSEFQPINNIKNGYCAFFEDTNKGGILDRTLQAPSIAVLPQNIQGMFKNAFLYKGIRPCAEKWFYELLNLRKTMCKCAENHRHEYYSALTKCPWCSFEKEYVYKMQDMQRRIRNKNKGGTNKSGDFKTYEYVVKKPIAGTNAYVQTQASSSSHSSNSNQNNTSSQNKIEPKSSAAEYIEVILGFLIPIILIIIAYYLFG